ncbi:MAG: clan AA aspartic protease [Chloroflexi bacterium]|nr:clan AA aspartic protease [Chloroflexota bacterium]MYB22663.1 clan AA aspartic protease [Chloroflexota bacterium]MYD17160.1 clan AA aspartic protease [Chloroflexota bacterium]MYI04654.1 clan AA aspartic protease [Chloroflexota bacterium]
MLGTRQDGDRGAGSARPATRRRHGSVGRANRLPRAAPLRRASDLERSLITGRVNADYEAIVVLDLQGHTGEKRRLEAVVDTGFSGFLTVTPAIVTELALPFLMTGRAILADGSEARFPVRSAVVLWDDQPVSVEVEAADTTLLIGMRLLEGYRLCADSHDGGRVTIEQLP